jgi:hypothetical protein
VNLYLSGVPCCALSDIQNAAARKADFIKKIFLTFDRALNSLEKSKIVNNIQNLGVD